MVRLIPDHLCLPTQRVRPELLQLQVTLGALILRQCTTLQNLC